MPWLGLSGHGMEVTTVKRHSFTSHSACRALGVAGIVGFVALTWYPGANVLTRFHVMNTAKAEDSSMGARQRGIHSLLNDEGQLRRQP